MSKQHENDSVKDIGTYKPLDFYFEYERCKVVEQMRMWRMRELDHLIHIYGQREMGSRMKNSAITCGSNDLEWIQITDYRVEETLIIEW